ncbi:MAG TPA: 50S ribosomal protein L37ae [Candidatus Bathyarchaeia archaeon]|nr:50S ribosomal protein L37ae [Candidatus Bathyarchaeia archaeon]
MGKKRMKKIGSTRGFEARYGSTVRKRYIAAISGLKKAHECPKCGSTSVRRQSVGVWKCGKCSAVFAGGAYMPTTKLGEIAKRAAKGVPTEAVAVEQEGE